jgi:hypothetical protein
MCVVFLLYIAVAFQSPETRKEKKGEREREEDTQGDS